MKYFTQGVVFSEIPDEITLELGISNCPFRCEGCHSPFLQQDVGTKLTLEVLRELIENNDGISCILFSGGSPKEVEEVCHYISILYPDIKTAWYTDSLKAGIQGVANVLALLCPREYTACILGTGEFIILFL